MRREQSTGYLEGFPQGVGGQGEEGAHGVSGDSEGKVSTGVRESVGRKAHGV